LSGCGIAGVALFCCAVCRRLNSSERPFDEADAWRRLVVEDSGGNARGCERRRRGPRGRRTRGIECMVAMVVRLHVEKNRKCGSPKDEDLKMPEKARLGAIGLVNFFAVVFHYHKS
jgi:hypothetical protein